MSKGEESNAIRCDLCGYTRQASSDGSGTCPVCGNKWSEVTPLPTIRLAGPGRMPGLIAGVVLALLVISLGGFAALGGLGGGNGAPAPAAALDSGAAEVDAAGTQANVSSAQAGPTAAAPVTDTQSFEPVVQPSPSATTTDVPTATSVPTDTPRPTSTPVTPTNTPAPSDTPTVQPTSTAVTATANRVGNLRGGPGTNYAIVGQVKQGQELLIQYRSPGGNWYQLRSGQWIGALLVDNPPEVGIAPVIPPSPVPPTPAPATATATPAPAQ